MTDASLAEQSFILRSVRGFAFPFQGLGHIFSSPGTFLLAAAPAAITLSVFIGLLALGVAIVPDLLARLLPLGELSAAEGAWEVTWWVLRVIAYVLFYALTALAWLVAFVTLFLGLSEVFSAPFNELLSERLEEELTGVPAPPFELRRFLRDIWLAIGHSLLSVSILVTGTLILALLGWLVPVLGTVVAFVGSALLLGLFFTLAGIESPASRRRYVYRRKLALVRSHFWVMAGFAGGCFVLVAIPLVNLLTIGAITLGGTRMFLALEGPREA